MRARAREWVQRRTSRADDWPLERALRDRAVSGATVSVVIPARNEQDSVGPIVAAVRADLVERAGLVDELLVVDSDSTDATARVARRAGATVLASSAVLPGWGSRPGKGEALWKGLASTRGELVVFLDADVRTFRSGWVVALLGPLLADPGIAAVKATYDRPLAHAGGVAPAGGGRVTELVARPLANLWWPDLAGFGQPLAGEFAGRRTVLEQLPFAGGYGVEFGLLVDLLDAVGLDGLAQVDLGVREHRHQPDEALGAMSSHVLQVALARLARRAGAPGLSPTGTTLSQLRAGPDGYQPDSRDVTVQDRPPLATLAEYRAARAAGLARARAGARAVAARPPYGGPVTGPPTGTSREGDAS